MKSAFVQRIVTAALLLGAVLFVSFYAVALAQSPSINYQGKLTDENGLAVADGTYDMEFRLYTTATSGSPVWTEVLAGPYAVEVENGLFSVMLGASSSLASVNFTQTLYLGVNIEADGEMTPRKILGTVPAAFESKTLGGVASTSFVRSDEADTISASTSAALLTITQTGSGDILNLFDGGNEVFSVLDGGNVGIGSSTPSSKLTVTGGGYFGGNLTATGTLTILGNSSLQNASTTNLTVLNRLYDGAGSAGTSGMVLQTTGSGVTWVATSTLGFASSFSNSAQLAALLSDETGTGAFVLSSSPAFGGTATFSALSATSTFTLSGTAANIALGSNYLSGDGDDEGVSVDSTGNVGIGTTTMTRLLNVSAASNAGIMTFDTTNNLRTELRSEDSQAFIGTFSNHDLRLITNNTSRVTIDTSGRVGIGSTTPSARLTVGGGDAYFGGSITATGTLNVAGHSTLTSASTTNITSSGSAYLADMRLTGTFRDSVNASGTLGMVMLSTGTSTQWVATSSLGMGAGFSDSAGLAGLLSDETGSVGGGLAVFSNGPTFTGVTTLANASTSAITVSGHTYLTGLTASRALFVDSLNRATTTGASADLMASVSDETGTSSLVFSNSPVLVTPNLGTPSAVTLTNATGLPIATGVSGLGANVATFLATPSSANLISAVTDETGTGNLVFSASPTFTGRAIFAQATTTDLQVTGMFKDSVNASGTLGMVLQSTGTSTQWVATTSLGFPSGHAEVTLAGEDYLSLAGQQITANPIDPDNLASADFGDFSCNGTDCAFDADTVDDTIIDFGTVTLNDFTNDSGYLTDISGESFLDLSDTQSSFTANRIIFTNSGGSALTDSAALVFANSNLGVGSTTPSAKLTVTGNGYFGGNLYATGTLTILGDSSLQNASTTNLSIANRLYDGANSAGTSGMVLQTTGSGVVWVATSSLGISSGANILDDLTDVDTTGAVGGNVLAFDGSNWVDFATSSLDLGPTGLMATDFGSFSCNGTTCAVDSGALTAAMQADGDHGFFSYSSGVASLDANGLSSANVLSAVSDETGTGNLVFSASPTFTGTAIFANSTTTNLGVTGTFRDSVNASGTLGMVLQSTGTSTQWVATSTLGSSAAFSNSAELAALLSDETGTSGGFVRASSSMLTNPTIINASTSAITVSGHTYLTGLTASRGLFVDSLNRATTTGASADLIASLSDETGSGAVVFGTNPTISNASSTNMTLAGVNYLTGLTASRGLFLDSLNRATTTGASADLANSLSDETGTGNLVFSASPTFTGRAIFAQATTTDLQVTGMFKDSVNASGTLGMVLQSTGTSTRWVATSSLGISAAETLSVNDLTDGRTGGTGLFFLGTDATTTNNYSFAIGADALDSVVGGSVNFAIGTNALTAVTSGDNNMAIGTGAGQGIEGGNFNLAIGQDTLSVPTNGIENTAVGYLTLENSIGDGNTAIGAYALNALGDGDANIAIGMNAGDGLGTNTYNANIFIGNRAAFNAGNNLSNNILIGYEVADNLDSNNNIIIGHDIQAASTTRNGQLNIGNLLFGTGIDGINTTLSSGNIGIGSTTPSSKLTVVGGGYFGGNITATGTLNVAGHSTLASASTTNITSSGSAYLADMRLTGTFRDSVNASGTLGMVMLSTGTSTRWVATSTLGISAGAGTFLGLTDVSVGSFTANRIPFTNGGATALIDDADFVFDGSALGLGTTTPTGRLSMQNTGFTGSGTMGTTQYFQSTNSSLNAVEFGNTTNITFNPSATSTMAGGIIRITDSSSLGNTVRGLEVQADRGGNIYGENTGVSAFGRTFGVRGTTQGDAGALFEPAGVIGDTNGTTQGNAIRGYSDTITSAALLKLLQETSTFTGTGLLMELADGSGTFSGNFIDLKNNDISQFTIASDGDTYIAGTLAVTGQTTLGNATTTNLGVTGTFRDSVNASGTLGMVLQATGTSTRWVATSTLGISGSSFTNSAELAALLSDETGTGSFVLSSSPAFGGTATFSALTASSTVTLSGNTSITNASSTSGITIGGHAYFTNLTASRGLFVDSLNRATTTGTSAFLTSSISDETGSGALVFGTNPTISNASTTGGLTLAGVNYFTGLTAGRGLFVDSLNRATTTATSGMLSFSLSDETGSGPLVFASSSMLTNPTIINASTSAITVSGHTYLTGLTASRGLFVDSLNRATTTGASADLAASLSDETGTGAFALSSSPAFGGTATFAALTASSTLTLSGTAANIALGSNFLSGDGQDEGVFVDGNGNVGIGTTTPAGKLDVWGNFVVGTSSSSTLLVNSALRRIGIGTSTAVSLLSLAQTADSNGLRVSGFDDEGNEGGHLYVDSAGTFVIDVFGPTGVGYLSQGGNAVGGWTSARFTLADDKELTFGDDSDYAWGYNQSDDTLRLVDGSDVSTNVRLTMNSAGNFGIGTTTPTTKLTIASTSITGTSTFGTNQHFILTNASNGAVMFANHSYIVASNTATSTLVGSIVRIVDSTSLGNVVRGLEVQAERGTNTLGENTALSGFARTFGVRGTTRGDAGGTYEPAGGYFETEGTTQGNAIRGYSDTITSASLLALFQETSTFTGTGLQMNLGNGTGSFTGNFLDLQNAGTSKFLVTQHGTTTIGDGTTNNMAGLQIGYGGLCVDNDGSCVASTTGRISAVSYHTGNSDLAEMYFSSQDLEPGEIVYADGGLSIGRASEDTEEQIIGVVSTKPGLTLGFDDTPTGKRESGYPVALTGRVPIKLSTENGPIAVGDQITLSSIPGVGMKARAGDVVVGSALEAFDGSRAYSKGFANQFGDDIRIPNTTPHHVNDDPRAGDGCSFGGGGAIGQNGAQPCVPTVAGASTDWDAAGEAAVEAVEEQIDEIDDLTSLPAERVSTASGTVAVGQALMFVKLGRFDDGRTADVMRELLATSTDLVPGGEGESLWDRLKTLAQNFVDGVLSVTRLKAKSVEVEEQLCVDDVCVTADDLRELLNGNGSGSPPPAAPVTPPEGEAATETTETNENAGQDDGEAAEAPAVATEPAPESETAPEPTPPAEPPPESAEPVEEPEPDPEPEPAAESEAAEGTGGGM